MDKQSDTWQFNPVFYRISALGAAAQKREKERMKELNQMFKTGKTMTLLVVTWSLLG